MILIDVNLLLYAYDSSSPKHSFAKNWFENALAGDELVRFAWVTVLAFVRIGTHPRVYAEPMTVDEATDHVGQWFSTPMVDTLEPGLRHWGILERLLRDCQASGNLVTDAYLAALAIEHGATLQSADRDFARFDGLTWINPLQ